MNNYDKQVIEEFDEEFDNLCEEAYPGVLENRQEQVKQFILKSLQSQKEMFMKCVPEKEEHYEGDSYMQYGEVKGWNDCREQILQELDKKL